MKHIAAYLLAVLGGNASPSAKDITSILSSVGIDADKDQLTKVISELADKDVEEIIASGMSKLASVPSGGGAASAGAAASGGAAPAASAPVAAKVEEKEESDEDMGFGLFD